MKDILDDIGDWLRTRQAKIAAIGFLLFAAGWLFGSDIHGEDDKWKFVIGGGVMASGLAVATYAAWPSIIGRQRTGKILYLMMAICAIFLGDRYRIKSDPMTQNCLKVRVGMSREQVLAVMGKKYFLGKWRDKNGYVPVVYLAEELEIQSTVFVDPATGIVRRVECP